ncbi:uncharacterized protein TrAFT101_006714 [Trichoderma asperellum]|uniref:Uncharacterized protein n=1 Tax=Trichoderma asperellum (strain ATCC 204424 / CBS 433.97 / NBRC 101777) TaxID=1042311 RepID=A0A2T3Z1K3_TRIA4|nr:hypothetical protein M441DRAFT_38847 [Trichoderma asperellum CBS 433.97]PTB38691.1 hypothetical protein M441DRAFT_38847 [Trichoderma asperellum CBS 433.97]UKZ91744.1 hypothetical protein TrAFT101_006714 [Trichoderma asperellum]
MPLRLSTKKASTVAATPEAMSSEVTLVDSSNTRSDKKATSGPSTKKTKMTWKEARAHCKKQENWEARVSAAI